MIFSEFLTHTVKHEIQFLFSNRIFQNLIVLTCMFQADASGSSMHS